MYRIRSRYPNAWQVMIDIGAAGLIVYFVVVVALLRSTQTAAVGTNERVLDCTEPTGQCYQDAQARTGQLVGVPPGPLNTVTVLASACAAGYADLPAAERIAKTTDCVVERLRRQEEKR